MNFRHWLNWTTTVVGYDAKQGWYGPAAKNSYLKTTDAGGKTKLCRQPARNKTAHNKELVTTNLTTYDYFLPTTTCLRLLKHTQGIGTNPLMDPREVITNNT